MPRSGTNYLEYLVHNNLDINYDSTRGSKNPYFDNRIMSIKHDKPSLKFGDKHIIIYKSHANFSKSFNKWNKNKKVKADDLANAFISSYVDFYNNNAENTIIIKYDDLIDNEEKYVEYLSKELGVKRLGKLVMTKNQTNNSGGLGVMKKKANRKLLPSKNEPDVYNKIAAITAVL